MVTKIRAGMDRNEFGIGLIEYIQTDLICKRTDEYNPKYNECIWSEISWSFVVFIDPQM